MGAWKRDIEDGVPNAGTALEVIEEVYLEQGPWSTVSIAVQRFMADSWLRQICLFPPELLEGDPAVFEWRFVSREEQVSSADVCARSASEILNIMLGPWFQGRQQVDYEIMLMLIRWSMAGMLTPNHAARIFKTEV